MNNITASVQGFLQTGQRTCHDSDGQLIPCCGSGQDAEFCSGQPWPETRFDVQGDLVLDRLTGLTWPRDANLAAFPLNWREALAYIKTISLVLFLVKRGIKLN